MGEIPVRVDLLTKISGVNYEEADKEKIIAEIPSPDKYLRATKKATLATNSRSQDRKPGRITAAPAAGKQITTMGVHFNSLLSKIECCSALRQPVPEVLEGASIN